MKRLALIVCAAAALILAATAQASERTIYVKNESTVVHTAEAADVLETIEQATNAEFGHEWNVSTRLVLVDAVPPGAAWLELRDHPDCFFCAAYHDVRDNQPHGVIGVDGPAGYQWSNAASHEIFELLVDPFINRGMLVQPRPGARPRWYAAEVCDPVEADDLGYQRRSPSGRLVWISDWITEAWFQRGSPGPWDFTGATDRPLQILDNGYQLVWTGWTWGSLNDAARRGGDRSRFAS